jgi:tryptophanyl-tRNA synthetase
LLPGLDGRKMSKSYDNTIPLFTPREQLRKLIAGVLTDSRAPGEPKEVEGSALFQIFQAFASATETAQLRQAYTDGIAWGDAKQRVFERIDLEVSPLRERYHELISAPDKIEMLLQAGAEKARAVAAPFMGELRRAVGLRKLGAVATVAQKSKAIKTAAPAFKQYREKDGRFYFKLLDAQAHLLLQSHGFDSHKEAALTIAALQQEGSTALARLQDKVQTPAGITETQVNQALQFFAPVES